MESVISSHNWIIITILIAVTTDGTLFAIIFAPMSYHLFVFGWFCFIDVALLCLTRIQGSRRMIRRAWNANHSPLLLVVVLNQIGTRRYPMALVTLTGCRHNNGVVVVGGPVRPPMLATTTAAEPEAMPELSIEAFLYLTDTINYMKILNWYWFYVTTSIHGSKPKYCASDPIRNGIRSATFWLSYPALRSDIGLFMTRCCISINYLNIFFIYAKDHIKYSQWLTKLTIIFPFFIII